ncbi:MULTISPECIES: L-histidine N(alpha)-methyltransferase [Delftia]|jgi:dimethylhistidine N-methyltransferase|uniref:L-histidine N(alpha)-methyltransferase n=1 Tax=Delftia TaxID=80865 RepID=UPI00020E8101|nr:MULTISPECIES: L-histidine N(alpha)-methyltransferase [Delftia]AEF89039.1 methyltransferase [Delftia sp. Cs1-4]MBK0115041.1 L-histidine N(alpha)-methyltransferase [Delftia sp. S65]MBK0120979.1 L-histidine N(alpha)-methyltransferase [Delftia sp. S67]MBK0130594.1 L-histidine N(alpha)-methyltransferase [Delftia sp. S66]
MLSAHDSTVSSSALASRAQRVPLPLPSAPRAPAQGGRREAAPEWADHALRATRAELQHGLMQPQAQVSPKYLYDARGCDLFEQITRLPEYYPTRTEAAILADSGAAMAEALRGSEVLIELGAGNCEKVRALCRSLRPRHFVGVDIAGAFLRQSVRRLAEEFPQLQAHAVTADITEPLTLPPHIPQAGRLLFYPGSSIGNFDPVQAQRMLGQMRAMVNDDGGLLIGIDLPKSTQWLEPAYDDAQGVTARFNLNLLSHVNSLLGSDFNPDDWEHVAFFNAEHSRIEMHLRARRPLIVGWPQGLRHFSAGETIHTENSYKYPLPEFLGMLACAGFGPCQVWTDERQWFAVIHAHA